MSKRWYNVVNPDDVCNRYGADTLRIYEMFLGPLDQPKPWDTRGIDGSFRFLKKVWRLYFPRDENQAINDLAPTVQEWKTLHKAIAKVRSDIDRLAFNTAVSALMVCVNELTSFKTNKRAILEPLSVLIAPFAPHIAEELWHSLGHRDSVVHAPYPVADPSWLEEETFEYPVSVNGKLRDKVVLPLAMGKEEVETEVLRREAVLRWLDGKPPKRVVVVPGKIVNVVV